MQTPPIIVRDPFVANDWPWWSARPVARSIRVQAKLEREETRDPETGELLCDVAYRLTIGGVEANPYNDFVTEHLKPVSHEEWLTLAPEPALPQKRPGILGTLETRQFIWAGWERDDECAPADEERI